MDSSQNGFEEKLGAALVGEVVGEETARRGTLAWLESLPTVIVDGRELPNVHRIPEGASWRTDAERGSRCALVRLDGSTCGAPATKRYGVCLPHLGGGGDLREMSAKGSAKLARLKVQREILGVGPRGMANPRLVARVEAAERASEIAAALLAPLDDRKLGAMDRQRAAAVILGETFPAATVALEVELPSDPAAVAELGWSELQALAAQVLEPVPNQAP